MLSREKQEIADRVHGLEEGLVGLSHEIHRHPEIGFQEYKVVDAIETYLKTQGMEIERNYREIPTPFRAVKKGKGEGPVTVFLAEYDAPRGVGHGCGHNVTVACVVRASLGMASKMDQYDGEIWPLGTPAKEGGAGKVLMLEQGRFSGVEFALMMHPTGGGAERNYINRGGRASGSITVSFRGKLAYSSVPSAGVNAPSAAISVLNQIDMIRPILGVQDNVNDVILEGETAGNIIPEFFKCELCTWTETMKRADELIGMIKGCIRRAQDLTSAAVGIEAESIHVERYPCLPLCKTFKENMGELGISVCYSKLGELFGSSDIGNVSIRIPAIHDYLSITDDISIEAHSTEYARIVVESRAGEICILGAEGLAMTAFDILTDGEFREESIAYHKEIVPVFHEKEQKIPEGEES